MTDAAPLERTQQMGPRRIAAAAGASFMVLALACGDERPPVSSSMTEATVKGTVKVKGKLATKGTVVFDPSNYIRKMERARNAPVGKDGSYTIKTLVGENVATYSGMPYDRVVFEVKEGENTLDIEVPLKP